MPMPCIDVHDILFVWLSQSHKECQSYAPFFEIITDMFLFQNLLTVFLSFRCYCDGWSTFV